MRRRATSPPDLACEEAARAAGARRVAGVDEAGRGPLAGPVVAAAVILDPARIPPGMDDSKRLSPGRRKAILKALLEVAEVSIGTASVPEIDSLNIWGATGLAMARALAPLRADFAIIDGPHVPHGLPCHAIPLVRGDQRALCVAAASIAAKVRRDAIMRALAQQDPRFDWGKNMGYPTAAHRAALAQHGPTQHHRRSFAPVRQMLCPDGAPLRR